MLKSPKFWYYAGFALIGLGAELCYHAGRMAESHDHLWDNAVKSVVSEAEGIAKSGSGSGE